MGDSDDDDVTVVKACSGTTAGTTSKVCVTYKSAMANIGPSTSGSSTPLSLTPRSSTPRSSSSSTPLSPDLDSSIPTSSTSGSVRKRSAVWGYFTIKDLNKKDYVTCDICQTSVKTKDSGTSNLFGHLKNHHPVKYAAVAQVSGVSKRLTKKPQPEPLQRTLTQVLDKNTKYSKDSKRHKDLTHQVTNFIVSGMVPIYIVDQEPFRKLIQACDPRFEMPGRMHFSRVAIPNMYLTKREEVTQALNDAHWVSITSDGWTSVNGDPYMSLTAHYINNDWQLMTKCLKTQYHPASHTAENIKDFINDCLQEYSLRPGNIVTITTDSAANMVAAARKTGIRRIPCIGHLIHNSIQKALEDSRVVKVLGACRSIVSLMNSSSKYRQLLQKSQKDLGLPQHQLCNDVATRWGSKFKMLNRIKEQMTALNSIFMDDRKYRHLSINWQDANTIDSVLRGLDGFYLLTDLLSGEKEVTVSSFIPLLKHVHLLCQTDDSDDELSKHIKETVQLYLMTRLGKDNDLLMYLRIAELLDPRYLMQFDEGLKSGTVQMVETDGEVETSEESNAPDVCTSVDLPSATVVKEEAVKLAVRLHGCREESNKDTVEPGKGTTSSSEPLVKKTRSLVGLLASRRPLANDQPSAPSLTTEAKVQRELDFYIQLSADDSVDVIKWWEAHHAELPLLSELARYALTSCATSVASERLFSLSGHIVSKRRNALKPSMVDMLAFLAFNR